MIDRRPCALLAALGARRCRHARDAPLRRRRDSRSSTSTDITGAEFARDFALTDHDGKPRTLADFKGKVAVVFFGYTQCPDVCPTTMAELAQVKQMLGSGRRSRAGACSSRSTRSATRRRC